MESQDQTELQSYDRKRKATGVQKKYSKRRRKKLHRGGDKSGGSSSKENEKSTEDECVTENEANEKLKEINEKVVNVKKEKKVKSERYVYPDEKGPCTCNICGKVISNKYGLREHQSVVHFKNGRFECEVCGKRVTNKRALNLHMTSHSSERSYRCDKCGSCHKTKGNLSYHIKTMHQMVKNFRCDLCFKTFKVQAELKEHCFSQHASEGKITCIVCKKKLTTPLSIYTHSVMHSGAREFECEICEAAFKTLTGLKEHKITHLENKPARGCPHCDKKFYSRSQYNAHVMRHTSDGTLITYKCPVCDVKFQHKSSYNRHVIRHQPGGDLEFPKENPYLLLDESDLPDGVCHKCRKYYASKSGFYLHLKKCRDGIVQQFQCPFCDRGCSNRSSLKRHIQRRHKDVEFESTIMQGEILNKETDSQTTESSQQGSAINQENGMQFQTQYFEQGYGNQIDGSNMVTTVDASQLSQVDVQLLIDTAAAAARGNNQAANILSNVGQVSQISNPGEAASNLHILSENEAAQFAAQLTQQGVIVRSSDMAHEPGQDQQQLIVSSAHIDTQTGQLLVTESQAAQIIANAQAFRESQLSENNSGLTLQTSNDGLLRNGSVLHFNNRTAVIQIHHNPSENVLPSHQVLSISNQHLQENTVNGSQPQAMQPIDSEAIQVTEIDSSDSIRASINNSEHGQIPDIQSSQTLQLAQSGVQNQEMSNEISSTGGHNNEDLSLEESSETSEQTNNDDIHFNQLEEVPLQQDNNDEYISNSNINSTVITTSEETSYENLNTMQ